MKIRKVILLVLFLFSFIDRSSARHYNFEQIGIKEGLSYNYVTSMCLDNFGRLWVGTSNGLNMISNGKVTAFTQTSLFSDNILIGRITGVVPAGPDVIVATESSMLLYDTARETFSQILRSGMNVNIDAIASSNENIVFYDSEFKSLFRYDMTTSEVKFMNSLSDYDIESVKKILFIPDRDNVILLVTDNSGIFEYNITTMSLVKVINSKIYSAATFLDSHNNLWVSPYNEGVRCYDTNDNYSLRSSYSKSQGTLTDDAVLSITESGDRIFISTDGGGLNVIDHSNGMISVINAHLVQSATILLTGRNGDVMAGTTHYGVVGLCENFINTYYDSYVKSGQESMSNSSVLSLYEDAGCGVWLGTDGGGLNFYDETDGSMTMCPTTEGMKVNSICPQDDNSLLLMLYNEGIYSFDKRTGKVSRFCPTQIPDIDFSNSRTNYIKMVPLNNGNILFFNWADKGYIYHRCSGVFEEFTPPVSETGTVEILNKIKTDNDYTLTVGRSSVYEFNITSLSFTRIFKNDYPFASYCYSDDGNFWYTDDLGIGMVDLDTGYIERPSALSGICNAMALCADHSKKIWIATSGGMVLSYDTISKTVRYYSNSDGVEEQYFVRKRPCLSTTHGNVFIPGASGLMIISESEIKRENHRGIELLSVSIDGEAPSPINSASLSLQSSYSFMELNIIGVQNNPFASQRYRFIESSRSFEQVIEGKRDKFIFRHRDPGNYKISVSVLTNNGWSEPKQILDIKVKEPFFKRWYMISAYLLLLLCIGIVLESIRERKSKLKELQKEQEIEKKQIEEKIEFMTNVAHELRTPLSLIYNPVKRLMERNEQDKDLYETMLPVSHQLSKMSNMINMVLDIQKMDCAMTLFIEPIGLNQWVRKIGDEFLTECREKGLSLKYELDEAIGDVNLDCSKIEIALSNLIMNAIKYSQSGDITIMTSVLDNDYVQVAVKDEGKGFTGDPEKLFQRFFQGNNRNSGYGIGLSYTKKIVEKHGGKIGAKKNEESGSIFYFNLPLNLEVEKEMMEYRFDSEAIQKSLIVAVNDDDFSTNDQTLLIVDNQETILTYIKSEYKNLFKHIYTATNGREALDIVKYKLPSIVVSDVVMPLMNGFELCKAMKTDLSISHIPIILLTARDNYESQEMGYKLGADCFVPKPFDIKMLYFIIRNQLKNRIEIKRQYSEAAFNNVSKDITFSIADEKFMLKLNKFLLNNISNPDLSIDMVIDHMCISKSTLFYKMNDLTGMSCGKYIKKMRIDTAKEMLLSSDMSINDISNYIGFTESRYFSTVFKQETGQTPSQYKQTHQQKG